MSVNTPIFDHAPQRGRFQMIAYGGGRPLEFFLGAHSRRAAKRKANDAAKWYKRERFIVRGDDGKVLYDGPVLDALNKPIYYRDGRAIYASDPEYARVAA